MTFYADLIFLFNFIMDAILLLATARARKLQTDLRKIVLASAVGASYAVLMFFPPLSVMYTILVKFSFSVLMVWIAFRFRSLQYFLRNLGVFYMVSFVLAGGVFAFHYFFQSSGEVMSGIYFSHVGAGFPVQIGLLFVIVTLLVLIGLCQTVLESMNRRQTMDGFMAEVEVHIAECVKRCVGLIDTGNQLYDPLTRIPVMVVEASVWSDCLPVTWMSRLARCEADQIIASLDNEEWAWQDRLRLVPYRGVNRGTQFMLAVKPDKVVIIHNGRQTEAKKVLVALDAGTLSSEGCYRAIIHPAMLQMNFI